MHLSRFLHFWLALLVCVLGLASRALAQAPTPTPSALSAIFSNKGELGIGSVTNTARSQTTTTPNYKSNGLETRTFDGFFQAASNTSKLAILSDDGSSVSVDGHQILNRAGQGQGFENFDSCFAPLTFSFTAGQTYHITVQYTNTTHLGDADVDGVSLWAYDGGGDLVPAPSSAIVPSVTFTGLARACAGGIGGDSVHSFTITGTAKRDDGTGTGHTALVTDTDFKLSFDNNRGHDYSSDDPSLWPSSNWTTAQMKKAKFVTTGTPSQVENLTVHTGANGQFNVTVLSSDIVSNDINIHVKWRNANGEDVDAGIQACDFGKTESKRLFPHFSDPGEDNGWIINFPDLYQPGDWTPAKVYLKFKPDTLTDDTPPNWRAANGHRVRMRIKEVQLRDGSTVSDPTAIQDYAVLTNVQPNQAQSGNTSFIMTTSGDGGAQVWLKAHDRIGDAVGVTLEPIDLSRFNQ